MTSTTPVTRTQQFAAAATIVLSALVSNYAYAGGPNDNQPGHGQPSGNGDDHNNHPPQPAPGGNGTGVGTGVGTGISNSNSQSDAAAAALAKSTADASANANLTAEQRAALTAQQNLDAQQANKQTVQNDTTLKTGDTTVSPTLKTGNTTQSVVVQTPEVPAPVRLPANTERHESVIPQQLPNSFGGGYLAGANSSDLAGCATGNANTGWSFNLGGSSSSGSLGLSWSTPGHSEFGPAQKCVDAITEMRKDVAGKARDAQIGAAQAEADGAVDQAIVRNGNLTLTTAVLVKRAGDDFFTKSTTQNSMAYLLGEVDKHQPPAPVVPAAAVAPVAATAPAAAHATTSHHGGGHKDCGCDHSVARIPTANLKNLTAEYYQPGTSGAAPNVPAPKAAAAPAAAPGHP